MPDLEAAERGLFTLKATTTVSTEQGTFEAVISTGSVDRDRDIVEPGAMVAALQKWIPTGKKVPLDWNHGTAAADQIGHIDPASVKAVDGEVVATGWIDQSIEAGKEAWRLVKSGTLGFSFYGLIPKSGVSKRKGGGFHVRELEVAAVTATPTPANNETRVLAWKALETAESEAVAVESLSAEVEEPRSEEDLRAEADKVERAQIAEKLPKEKKAPDGPGPEVAFPENEALKAMVAALRTEMDSLKAQLEARSEDELRKESDRVERQMIKEQLPETEPPEPTPDMVEVLMGEVAAMRTELETVGEKLGATEKELKGVRQAVEEPKRANAGSRDDLRKRADRLCLEVQTDGISSRKPPKQEPQEPVHEAPLDEELKQMFQRQMLESLTGDMPNGNT